MIAPLYATPAGRVPFDALLAADAERLPVHERAAAVAELRARVACEHQRLGVPIGRQDDGAGGWLELRNCLACGSTVSREVEP